MSTTYFFCTPLTTFFPPSLHLPPSPRASSLLVGSNSDSDSGDPSAIVPGDHPGLAVLDHPHASVAGAGEAQPQPQPQLEQEQQVLPLTPPLQQDDGIETPNAGEAPARGSGEGSAAGLLPEGASVASQPVEVDTDPSETQGNVAMQDDSVGPAARPSVRPLVIVVMVVVVVSFGLLIPLSVGFRVVLLHIRAA